MAPAILLAAVFGAVIRDHTPENRARMFQGLRIVGQVLVPGVIGPAIGAAVLWLALIPVFRRMRKNR